MRIQCDTLRYAILLKEKGLSSDIAEGFMRILSDIEIFNIYSMNEVNGMLSESIEKIFTKQDLKLIEQRREWEKILAKQDLKLAEQRREFDAQLKEQRNELLSSRRWVIGTIITVGLSLAAYLSALIHFNH